MIHVDVLGFSCDLKVYVLPDVVRLDAPVRHADGRCDVDVTYAFHTDWVCKNRVETQLPN